MLPGRQLDSQLKELRSQSAHDWASDRFFTSTAKGPQTLDRVGRYRRAALIMALLCLVIWLSAALVAADVLPQFAVLFLLVAFAIFLATMHLASRKGGAAPDVRDEMV